MATTLNQNDMISPCQSSKSRSGNGMVVRNGGEDDAPIPFHRHCQKTICSAYSNGQGATWNILNDQKDSLTNLPGWISYFTSNNGNITEDLLSILRLINWLAQTIKKSWTLTFKDNHNNKIASETMNPWKDYSLSYVFSGFGRDIELSVDGQTLKFNTMRALAGNAEKLRVDFPRKKLMIQFNGEEQGDVDDIYMSDDVSINIKQDFNKVTCNYAGGEVTITGDNHIFRHYEATATTVSPLFNIAFEYSSNNTTSQSPIVEWEYHLRNITNSADGVEPVDPGHRIYVGVDNGDGTRSFNVKVDGESYFYKIIGLTDQMYVDPGQTNVYVFRADMHKNARILTYSLAYVYAGGRPREWVE